MLRKLFCFVALAIALASTLSGCGDDGSDVADFAFNPVVGDDSGRVVFVSEDGAFDSLPPEYANAAKLVISARAPESECERCWAARISRHRSTPSGTPDAPSGILGKESVKFVSFWVDFQRDVEVLQYGFVDHLDGPYMIGDVALSVGVWEDVAGSQEYRRHPVFAGQFKQNVTVFEPKVRQKFESGRASWITFTMDVRPDVPDEVLDAINRDENGIAIPFVRYRDLATGETEVMMAREPMQRTYIARHGEFSWEADRLLVNMPQVEPGKGKVLIGHFYLGSDELWQEWSETRALEFKVPEGSTVAANAYVRFVPRGYADERVWEIPLRGDLRAGVEAFFGSSGIKTPLGTATDIYVYADALTSDGTVLPRGSRLSIDLTGGQVIGGISSARLSVPYVAGLPRTVGYTRGDVNDDGAVDIHDALRVAAYAQGNEIVLPETWQQAAADWNFDGVVTAADADAIAQRDLDNTGQRLLFPMIELDESFALIRDSNVRGFSAYRGEVVNIFIEFAVPPPDDIRMVFESKDYDVLALGAGEVRGTMAVFPFVYEGSRVQLELIGLGIEDRNYGWVSFYGTPRAGKFAVSGSGGFIRSIRVAVG